MDNQHAHVDELQQENAALRAEIARLKETPQGVSRRQLLAGGAGVLGAVAGAGILAGGRPAGAASDADTSTTYVAAAAAATNVQIFMLLKNGDGANMAPGSITQKGFAGSIAVIELSHSISTTVNSAGVASNQRKHEPFTIVKQTDKASPKLYGLFSNDANIPSLELSFLTPSSRGPLTFVYKVTLADAMVASIDFHYGPRDGLAQTSFDLYEQVSFSYDSITWEWKPVANDTASDNWQPPLT